MKSPERAPETQARPGAAQAVHSEIVIDALPERVFDAWADPAEIARWYLERQDGDPRRERRIVWHIGKGDGGESGEPLAVKTAERGRRLVLENVGDGPWRGTVLDVALAAEGTRTRVSVRQSGFSPALRDHVPSVEAGWTCMLAVLKEYLQHHRGCSRRVVEETSPLAADPALVAEALASADAVRWWAGERPARMLASTPRGAVLCFDRFPGVFIGMGVGRPTVAYTVWGDGGIDAARRKTLDLAERFGRAVQRVGATPAEAGCAAQPTRGPGGRV